MGELLRVVDKGERRVVDKGKRRVVVKGILQDFIQRAL